MIRAEAEEETFTMVAADLEEVFTTDHSTGYPVVVLRPADVDHDELAERIENAHAAASRPRKRTKSR